MRRRLLGSSLAALIIGSGSAQAQSLGVGVGLTVPGFSGGVPIGSLTGLTVLANGWQAQATFKGMTCAGSFGAYALTPDATPKLTLAVTSPGYDTSGGATTIARTVIATTPQRQAYSSNTSPTETQVASDCKVTLDLSDYLNVNDTATASALASAYTSGIGSAATSSVAVTNSSTLAHPTPICNWVTPAHEVIAPGSSFTVEVVCFHARPRSGKQVQAVKFIASDGTNQATCTTSTMARVNAIVTTGNPVYGYACTFAAGAFSGLTAGGCAAGASCEVSMDFIAYPIIGDTKLQASNGQDGVTIAASVRTPNLHARNFVWDQASKYSPVYGWVQSGGTCATNGCISTSSTDPGTGNAANYGSFYDCANNGKSYNNANRGHNDTAGVVCEIRAATYNGFHATLSLSSLTAGIGWLTFKGAPGTSSSTAVVTRASTSTGTAALADRTWFDGIGFAQVDSTSSAYNEEITGGDGANSNPVTTEVVINNGAFTCLASFPGVFQIGLVEYYNTTITAAANDCDVLHPFSTNRYAAMVYGGTINVASGINYWPHIMVGVQAQGMGIVPQTSNSANFIVPTGPIFAFNKIMKASTPFDINAPALFPSANFADVQNVYEKTTVNAGLAHRFLADADIQPFANFVEQYDTVVGGRENQCYNDGTSAGGGATSTAKSCVELFTVFGPMASQGYNIKTDTFNGAGLQNGARIGNWPVTHHVGNIGNIVYQAAGSNSGGSQTAVSVSGLSWLGEYWGLTGSGTANNVGYNQQVAFTTDASAGGSNAGNGTYTITGGSGSPAYGRVPAGFAGLPGDIAGTARANDGTGCAGAYESC